MENTAALCSNGYIREHIIPVTRSLPRGQQMLQCSALPHLGTVIYSRQRMEALISSCVQLLHDQGLSLTV